MNVGLKPEPGVSLLAHAAIPHAPQAQSATSAPTGIRSSSDAFQGLVSILPEGVWEWDVATGQVAGSPRWAELIGVPLSETGLSMQRWLERIHLADRPAFQAQLESLRLGWARRVEWQHRLCRDGRDVRSVEGTALAIEDRDGRVARVLGITRDVTKHKLVERRILFETYHDPLTGLPNRLYFDALVEQSLDRASAARMPGPAVIVIDIDQFHRVNDSWGHSSGNELLRATADRIRLSLRAGDVLARLNGDEFAVLLDGATTRADVEEVARNIQSAFDKVFELEHGQVFVSLCIGIVLAGPEHKSADLVVENAIRAAHHAKGIGRSHCAVFEPSIRDRQRQTIRQETDLRRALEHDEFLLHFQPIVVLASGRLAGFEALVRWRRENVLLTPDHFIPLAEEIGLIVPLGRWILTEASRQIAEWHARFPSQTHLAMNVNLSIRQFSDSELFHHLRAIKEEHKLPPHALRLEITESMMMDDANLALGVFQRLKEIGVGIHVDDFGTGYSSLSRLPAYPIDSLKIDRSFIDKMLQSRRSEQVVRTIVDLARALGIGVTAEGIESREQWTRLREMGCDQGQGYVFSAPLDAARAAELIATGPSWGG